MSPKKDNKNEQAAPLEQTPPAPEKKQKKNDADEVYLPVFVELVFRFSGFFLILVSLAVAAISFVFGADLLQIVLRTGTAVMVVGILAIILNSKIASGALAAAKCLVEEDSRSDGGTQTVEKIGQDIKA